MRKIGFLCGTAVAAVSSMLLLSLFISGPAATALQPATPTPYPLSTEVIPKYPSTITITTEDGEIFEADVIPNIAEPRPPDVGELVTETEHFHFHARRGYLPVDRIAFGLEAEEIFDYVSARLETATAIKPIVLFERPDGGVCPMRGGTGYGFDDKTPPIITIYADEQTSHEQVLGVLAHELGHALQIAGRGRHWDSAHIALREGQATWAAGQYWHTWQATPSFDASVRSYLDHETYLPLYEHVDLSVAYRGENCIERRDILYTEWAAFIDYLIITYGMDQLEALFHSSPPEEAEIDGEEVVILRPADFEGVYGYALNQLEAAWLRQINGQ